MDSSSKNKQFQLPLQSIVSEERKGIIQQCAQKIQECLHKHQEVHLIFVCTHNSRRSQACELWAQTWIHHLGHSNIKVYSAGTEKTRLNSRMIDAARRYGFVIEQNQGLEDEFHLICSPLETDLGKAYFSKTIQDSSLPENNRIAIMTCSHADENCPFIPGAIARLPLRYTDPSEYDGHIREGDYYDQTLLEIGSEMGYLFQQLER